MPGNIIIQKVYWKKKKTINCLHDEFGGAIQSHTHIVIERIPL